MKSKYMDSDPLYTIERGYNESTRMLMFHSTELDAEKLQEALDIIGKYNEFDSKEVGNVLLTTFGDKCRYVVGREYSVVVYVIPKSSGLIIWDHELTHVREQASVDEVGAENGRIRLWWD